MIIKIGLTIIFYFIIKFFSKRKITFISGLLPVFPLFAFISEISVYESNSKLETITLNNIYFIIPYIVFLVINFILLFKLKISFLKSLIISFCFWIIVSLIIFKFLIVTH